MKAFLLGAVLTVVALPLVAQQLPDYDFKPRLVNPEYDSGKGPVVLVDEGHANFHKTTLRYFAFSTLLRADGYNVRGEETEVTDEHLKKANIYVIANAIAKEKESDWTNPIPSAFSEKEISVLEKWVREGGSLLLIADHMPFPAATERLAKVFGFTFYNGFADNQLNGLEPGKKRELDLFSKSSGTLQTHPITDGRKKSEQIQTVATFTGQAFGVPDEATSLITLPEGYRVLLPDTAWKFGAHTPTIDAKGLSQGAVREFGKGRVAVFGEAAMFSSQVKGPEKIQFGFTAPEAKENQQFLLNVIHWLDRRL